MAYATGKYAKAISDRSGMEYPYSEMKTEWNGSFVHKSEYESKHPQLDPSDQLENGTVSSLLASLGVTSADRKITSTFTSANASPIATALTLSASLGSESVSVS